MYQIPAPPASGIVIDGHDITWRRNDVGTWDPEPCSQCNLRPAGGLTWVQLLEQRGPVTDASLPAGA